MGKRTKRILVIGSGAREHALAVGIAQSPDKPEVMVAPGNPGISEDASVVPDMPSSTTEAADWIASLKPELVVIGPEKPLSEGLADRLRERGIPVVGPSFEAAKIEGSKLFAKERMLEAGIPTADFRTVNNSLEVKSTLKEWGYPIVLKADGLAQGKGVSVIFDERDLELALDRFFVRKELKEAQEKLFLEKGLTGPEVSFIVLSDGVHFVPFPAARDYKRIGDGNTGPNTGGMGAQTPIDHWGQQDQEEASQIVDRCLWSLRRYGAPFSGFLYAGFMRTPEGLKVLEFNARFGDPEAQVLIPAAGPAFLELLSSAAKGSLDTTVMMTRQARVAVVLASEGYPDKPVYGAVLEGLDKARAELNTRIYTAGVAQQAGKLVASGGRVLSVVGEGNDLSQARNRAYHTMGLIRLEKGQFRSDIAKDPS
ncbi:MAG: phosphoribosylamine--glycine ligase [Leptospirales bacterium]